MQQAKRWSVITIFEPRYHDMKVLIATRKVNERNKIEITKGAYTGEYFVAGSVVRDCPIQSNGKIPCYIVPMSQLEKI